MDKLRAFFKTLCPQEKTPISKFQALRSNDEASPQLQQKLIDLVGGDRTEAERLVARERFGNDGKSEAYYWWKAIDALEQKIQKKGESW